jgi:hypothetical protein
MAGGNRERFLPAVIRACERLQPDRQVLMEFTAFQQRRDRVRVTVNGYVAVVVINQNPILVARYSPPWAVKNPSTAILDGSLLAKLSLLAEGRTGPFLEALKMLLGGGYVKITKVNRHVADALVRWLSIRQQQASQESPDESATQDA